MVRKRHLNPMQLIRALMKPITILINTLTRLHLYWLLYLPSQSSMLSNLLASSFPMWVLKGSHFE